MSEVESTLDVSPMEPVSRVRERDLDLLLAESLSTSLEFVEWFLERVPRMSRQTAVTSCGAVVNFHRSDSVAAGVGETDVLAEVAWADGETGLMSIEDKVLASSQMDQGRRHVEYLRGTGRTFTAAVLVAPAAWIDRHESEAEVYDSAIAVEEIARWHGGRPDGALRWRGRVFLQATKVRAGGEPAHDLDDWCADFDRALHPYGLSIVPQARQRTAASDQARSGRSMTCTPDCLGDYEDLVAYITFWHGSSATRRGRVGLYIEVAED